MYVIDEVLQPYTSREYHPHDAWEFLKNPSLYNIEEELSEMVSRIEEEKQENLFTKVGNHTYFIPVDQEHNADGSKFKRIDKAVMKGHIIPQHVLFTRTAGNEAYISSNPEVEIKLLNQTTSSTNVETMFVRSNTLQDSQGHEKE
ncbi:fasciclin-1-like [Tachypleus tridentatus]|uniref:fasciclin-1-like n=1 Tax=Tachypleus tridentatus TaxID=6853 RepID=UPI003FD13E90